MYCNTAGKSLNGKILSSHCNYMARLGESCPHVASLLWAVESGVRIRDSMTVTQKKAYWVMPTGVKEVQYAPVKSIDLLGKKDALKFCNHWILDYPMYLLLLGHQNLLLHSKRWSLFSDLSSCSSKSAILSLVEPFSSEYIPNHLMKIFQFVCLSYLELNIFRVIMGIVKACWRMCDFYNTRKS